MRAHRLLPGLGALLIAMSPIHALAQTATQPEQVSVSVRDRDRPEFAAQGKRLGAFTLNASLGIEVTSTNNLFVSRPELAVDEIYYDLSPQASLVSDWSRHALTIDGGLTARRHQDQTREDTDSHFLRAVGRFDISSDTAIHASTRTAHQVTPRTDPDVSDTDGVPIEYDRLDGAIGVSHRFARLTVRADAGQSDYDYQGSQNFRDNTESFVRGRIQAELTPSLGLVLQATADEHDYKNTPTLSSDGRTILGGVALNTHIIGGEILTGVFERDYASPSIGTIDGVAGAAWLEWYFTELTTLRFEGRRSADDQISGTSGLPFTTAEYGARIDHELRRNVIITAGYRHGERNYDPLTRRDEYIRYEFGADYLVNRRVAIQGRFIGDEISYSGVSIDDRDAKALTVGLSLRL